MNKSLSQPEVQWLIRTLRGIDFFARASLENIDRIIAGFRKQIYRRGKVIIKEGTPGTALFVIKSGKCLVYRRKGLFRREKLAELAAGDFFGEMSLLFDDLTSASVKAIEPAEIFVYLKSDFLRWLKDNPDLEKEIRPIAERRKYENILFGGRK